MPTSGVWTEAATVRSHEVTPHGTVSMPMLCTYLQAAAGRHADALGVSTRHLHANDQAWVLAHLCVEIEQLPRWEDEIVVETWPSGLDGLYATREFVLHVGEVPAVRASSAWLVFDTEKRRPARPPRQLNSIELPDRPPVLPHDWADLPRPERPDHTQTFAVRYHDLDVNRHVNNVRIMEWGLETLPPEMHDTFRCTAFSLQFKAEARLYDSIRAVAQVEPDGDERRVRHALRNADDDRTLAVARTHWSPRCEDAL